MPIERAVFHSSAWQVFWTAPGASPPPPPPPPPPPSIPKWDHIVYVWMENHSETQIFGNSSAPYINSLASANAKFTGAQAVAHPSQPNYLAAFSGSTQGVTDDNNHDLGNLTNIFTQLQAKSLTMKGYIETTSPRRHNPWESFSNTSGCEADFSTFPASGNYSSLPKVSWVVPNLTDDMHDGTIAQGDTWLQSHIDPVVVWAKSHNSLVIITWDEDDSNSANGNDIPLIMAGANVVPGTYSQQISHYDVLGLVQDACGVSRLGNSVGLPSMTYPFGSTPPPPPNAPPVASFTSTTSGTTVTFDGSASHDTNGITIASYLWDFGDGKKSTASSTATTSHTYATAGTFTVSLTVTATDKQTASTSATVKIVIANKPPVASFTASVSGGTVTFDGSASSDSDGQIVTYAWVFGDGATATGATASHTYSSGGTKNVSLTVTDNLGATGTISKSVVLSTVPVAAFTTSISGNTLSVDASPTTDTNPINSYSWNWGDSITVPTYSFDTANDKHIITLHPVSGNVLQCAVKSPDTGNVYAAQTGNGSNGTSTPYESMYLSRMDSTGALIDSMKLIDGGHGTSFALEFTAGKTHIWMAWQGPATTNGTHNDIVRFPYPVGGGTFTRASPPPGMTVPYPGGLNNGYKTDMQFDVQKNRVVLRSGGPPGYNTYRQAVLSDFLAGKLTIYNTVVVPSGPPTLQGYFTYDYSLFIYWGIAYTQPSGGPVTSPTDPPVLKEYRWYDGKEIASYDPSWWGKPYLDSHYEPESSTLYNPVGGAPSVWVGFITGTTGSYKQDLIQVPLLAGSQSVPGPGSSGKIATHTFASAGTYTVTLTVTDAVGQTDTQTKVVAVGATNQPPVASFASAGTNLTMNFNASASADSDGSIASYAWTFGDGATGTGVTPSHTYAAAGTYTVKLTVTDNSGATGSVTHTVSPTQGSSEPAGPDIVGYETLSGSAFGPRVNTAPAGKKVALAPGTFSFSDFLYGAYYTANSKVGGYGALISTAGLLGSGIDKTIVQMNANTMDATLISEVQNVDAYAANGHTGATTNSLSLLGFDASSVKLDGFTLRGTTQGAEFNGISVRYATSPVISNLKVTGIVGSDHVNPGETFSLNLFHCTGPTLTDVEIDGQGVGASAIGPNSSSGGTFTRATSHNCPFSIGFAFWQHTGGCTLTDCAVDGNRGGFNFENSDGTFELVRPRFGTMSDSDISGGSSHTVPFHINIRDPRNFDGTPLTRKLRVNFWSKEIGIATTMGPHSISVFNATGADITSTAITWLNKGNGQ